MIVPRLPQQDAAKLTLQIDDVALKAVKKAPPLYASHAFLTASNLPSLGFSPSKQLRTDTSRRKFGIPTKRILAASSDSYREALLDSWRDLMRLPCEGHKGYGFLLTNWHNADSRSQLRISIHAI